MLYSIKTSSKRICAMIVTPGRRSTAVSTPHRAPAEPVSLPIQLTQLEGLVTHLQNATELKDTALSHELHDELGGLMGAAVMDLDAVRRVKPALSQNALNRVDRVKKTLEQAIDLKRRVIEELRPSILDNFGLFAALRWQTKKTWGDSDVVSTENYPDVEPRFESHAATTLFRIAQEAISLTLNRTAVGSTDLSVSVDHGKFCMKFSDDGTSNADMQTADTAMILASMRHRIRTLGGNVQIFRTEAGATVLTVAMPLPNIVSD
jgi:signal transduction histidine kinase